MANGPSSIALALAGKTASVEIPKPRDHRASYLAGKDSFAAVAASSWPANDRHGGGQGKGNLLTPPNSLSPSFPPKQYNKATRPLPVAAGAGASASGNVDSDLDLQDGAATRSGAGDRTHRRDSSASADVNALEAAGAITPAMLAKHHLPDILLSQGPLAIRHVMGFLTTSVPGFSGIPPAKARRLVVGALEGRGNGEAHNGSGGGVNGDVLFEKVGWGRWDARTKGQAPRGATAGGGAGAGATLSPPPSMPSSSSYPRPSGAVPISRSTRGRMGSRFGTSWTGDSAAFSHDEDGEADGLDAVVDDVTMLEHEADKMSLDSMSVSSSDGGEEDDVVEGEGDATDDEDWANIGAAALRKVSASLSSHPGCSAAGSGPRRHMYQNYRSLYNTSIQPPRSRSGGRHHGHGHLYNRRVRPGGVTRKHSHQHQHNINHRYDIHDQRGGKGLSGAGAGVGGSDSVQEREAIEALVRLSSV